MTCDCDDEKDRKSLDASAIRLLPCNGSAAFNNFLFPIIRAYCAFRFGQLLVCLNILPPFVFECLG